MKAFSCIDCSTKLNKTTEINMKVLMHQLNVTTNLATSHKIFYAQSCFKANRNCIVHLKTKNLNFSCYLKKIFYLASCWVALTPDLNKISFKQVLKTLLDYYYGGWIPLIVSVEVWYVFNSLKFIKVMRLTELKPGGAVRLQTDLGTMTPYVYMYIRILENVVTN